MKNNLFIFSINKKIYISKLENYLIIDFINYKIKTKMIIKNILFFFNNFFLLSNNKLNINVHFIILKHFYIKSFSIKKKRRKNILKRNFNYKKKTLIYIQNII